MSIYQSAIAVCIGFVLANLLVATFTGRDWATAIHKAYIQIIAVIVFLVVMSIT